MFFPYDCKVYLTCAEPRVRPVTVAIAVLRNLRQTSAIVPLVNRGPKEDGVRPAMT